MKTSVVTGEVIACIPEYHQLEVRDAEGNSYAVVEGHAKDFKLGDYCVGQSVTLDVEWLGKAEGLPRVKKISPASI